MRRPRSLAFDPQAGSVRRHLAAALLVLLVSCTDATAAEPESWLRVPSEAQPSGVSGRADVPQKDIYEVVPTKVDTAIFWYLAKVRLAEITCSQADFLTGGHYGCELGKIPILVRAVYGNGGTGMFSAAYKDKTLYIFHGSLGDIDTLKNLPLIISLPSVPAEVYTSAGSVK